MEKISVKEVVQENKKNVESFGVFMSECLHTGRSLRQFLAEERLEGRVPLRGEESNYDPIKERVIVLIPQTWGADDPTELVGAAVRFDMIGTIPISDDDDGKITVVRLTEAAADTEPDIVFDDSWIVENAALCPLGRNAWVRLHPPPPMIPDNEPDDNNDDDNDSDDEGYW